MALTFTDEFLAKYDGLEPLGEGGMGTVYRGVQRSLERPVAIKFLSRQLLDEEYMCRFRSEAKLAGQVFHTNLVAVIETGSMGDVPFIVFELVEGASLREHVRRAGGSLSLREALDVVRQVAEGLAVAHGIGIVHRDIKPENILVGAKGVKVADFGVAKNAAASASQKTRSGVIMGTPA
ncbi:MAG: serine/threonine-protein kinase, partial [Chloroflexota bacterium]